MSFLRAVRKAMAGVREEPKFEVVNKYDGYEIRSYPETVWITLKITGKTHAECGRPEFSRLLGYINGNNETGVSLPMTSPVVFRVSFEESKDLTVSLFLSPSVEDPPKPKDSDMSLFQAPAGQLFVRTFSGFASDAEWKKEFEQLQSELEDPEEAVTSFYYRSAFDPPFKMVGRRNEVWIARKK
ncbi:heme-binding protein 1-like isoform X2 [Tachypleus tridentatus]